MFLLVGVIHGQELFKDSQVHGPYLWCARPTFVLPWLSYGHVDVSRLFNEIIEFMWRAFGKHMAHCFRPVYKQYHLVYTLDVEPGLTAAS